MACAFHENERCTFKTDAFSRLAVTTEWPVEGTCPPLAMDLESRWIACVGLRHYPPKEGLNRSGFHAVPVPVLKALRHSVSPSRRWRGLLQ